MSYKIKSPTGILNRSAGGFTLIELLIVVLVLAVLSGVILSVLNTSGVQQKARDGQRVGDLKRIQTALELFYSDNRSYPASTSRIVISNQTNTLAAALTGQGHISIVPIDPQTNLADNIRNSADPCTSNAGYTYITSGEGRTYVLTATMELPTSDDPSTCANLTNWTTLHGGCTPADINEAYCYGVQNP